MLEEVVVIVLVEERLDSIWTVDCSVGNVLCGMMVMMCFFLSFNDTYDL